MKITNSPIYIYIFLYITFNISYLLYRGYRGIGILINIFILIYTLKSVNYTKSV